MTSIAIIGAGSSGLAAAHTLLPAGWTVTIFEQSREIGGRAATRRRANFIYDDGAQYIKQGADSSITLITERFRAPDLIDIHKPVWIFDGAGHIQEGDPLLNAEPKWSYRSGLRTLAQRMAEGLDIRLDTQISQIQRDTQGWELIASNGAKFSGFDKLLITIPAPQASQLIQTSPLASELRAALRSHLDQASYNSLLSIVLGYRSRPQQRPYYALVNIDKAHAISWLAWEHEKAPERAPANTGLLIAQMAPQYSQEHWQAPDEAIIADVAQRVSTLLQEPLTAPFFRDLRRWRYALPARKANADQLNALSQPSGLAFCGDAYAGGRVHIALEHGIIIAGQLLQG